MKIDVEKCIGCKACHPYCTVGAIFAEKREGGQKSVVNQEECVECGACVRSEICPKDAIYMPELSWPRSVRPQFGNPYFGHPQGGHGAPPAPDMKLNDLHGKIKAGSTDVTVEVGRPGVSTSFRDVETVCTALVGAGVRLDPGCAAASVMEDVETGRLKADILGERALNVMIQFRVPDERLPDALRALEGASSLVDTVFSVSVSNRVEGDGVARVLSLATGTGFRSRPHTKTNVGLGRRLPQEG